MGYLLNDNRESGGTLVETDTVCCCHCQAVVLRVRYQTRGGWCWHCDGPVCYPCFERMQIEGCVPFRKWLDIQLGCNTNQVFAMYPNAPLVPARGVWFAPRGEKGLAV